MVYNVKRPLLKIQVIQWGAWSSWISNKVLFYFQGHDIWKKYKDTYSGQQGDSGQNEWSKDPHHGAYFNVQKVYAVKILYSIAWSWVINTKTKGFASRVHLASKMLPGPERLGKMKVKSRSENIDLDKSYKYMLYSLVWSGMGKSDWRIAWDCRLFALYVICLLFIFCTQCYGFNCVLHSKDVLKSLTSSTRECDLIWKHSLCRCH